MDFEIVDHTADLVVRFRGSSREQLFECAAYGLFACAIDDLEQLTATAERPIALAAVDDGELLVDWLNELLFLLEARSELHAWPSLECVDGGRLTGRTRYLTLDRDRQRFRFAIKAATYHGLRLERTADGWLAEVLFDL